MEEEIKEDAKKIIEYCKNSMNFKELGDRVFHEDIADFIENLIARNKELEKSYNIAYIGGKGFERQQWKEKIQKKIKALDEEEKEELKGLKGQDRYFIKQMYQAKRSFAEELLQERN